LPDPARIFDVRIESLGGLGDGIATLNGKPLFVPKACAGDHVRVRIIHENHDRLQGAIVELLEASPARATPPCPHFNDCGGCKLQQLSLADYHVFKTRMLRSALKQGGCPDDTAEVAFIGNHARRRVEFQLLHLADGVAIGFNALRTNHTQPIDSCLLVEPAIEALIAPLNEALSAWHGWPQLRYISLTAADSGIDMVLTLRCDALPDTDMLTLMAEKLSLARVSVRLADNTLHQVIERIPVTIRLGNYDVALSPDSFLQATRKGQELLVQSALQAAQPFASVVDLFCGIGTYSFPLSQHSRVHAVEGDAAMVQHLIANARQHGIASLTAEKRDLFKQPLTAGELGRFQAAIINPPRIGGKAQTGQLALSGIGTIAMISCNPATFARDAKILVNAGYRLTHALGIDQFVWSQHLEIVAIFKN
jgi:23S rRNA (uracil1939-C5)-methyltransferase